MVKTRFKDCHLCLSGHFLLYRRKFSIGLLFRKGLFTWGSHQASATVEHAKLQSMECHPSEMLPIKITLI